MRGRLAAATAPRALRGKVHDGPGRRRLGGPLRIEKRPSERVVPLANGAGDDLGEFVAERRSNRRSLANGRRLIG